MSFEIDDPSALSAMLADMPPEVAAQAESHGVIQPFTVYVEASTQKGPVDNSATTRLRPDQPRRHRRFR